MKYGREREGSRRAAVLAGAVLALALACDGGERPEDDAAAPNNTTAGGGNVSAAPAVAASSPARMNTNAVREESAAVLRVLVAGTSLTAGLGLDPADAYPAVLQRKADSAGYRVQVVNAGLSGETSAGLARRIDWLLTQHPSAAVVVIETGANDGLRGLDVDSLQANLRRIARAVRTRLPEAQLVLVQMEAPPNFGPQYTARFRAAFGEVARETGATLAPFLLEGVAGERALNQADGIHPNEEGARRAAAVVWRALEPVLDSLDRPLSVR